MFFRFAIAFLLIPCFVAAQEELDFGNGFSSFKDLVINASSINGSVIVNGDTRDSNITITGSDIQGDITFDNGCAVVGSEVYECDGSRRQMNDVEKKKMAKRRAQIIRKQHKRPKREAVNRKKKSKKNNRHYGKKKNLSDSGTFSPCKTCQQNKKQYSRKLEETD